MIKELIKTKEFVVDTNNIIGHTYNYEVFTLISSNRGINRSSVDQLKKSIRKEGYCPSSYVLVDEDFNILDGQHRFVACRELGLPIYTMCVPNLRVEHMRILNTISKNWTMKNFIEHYATLGSEDYVLLNNIADNAECALSVVLNLLFGHRGESIVSEIQLGTMKITEEEIQRYHKRYNNYKMLMVDFKENFKVTNPDDVKKIMDVLDNDFMCYSLVEKIKKNKNKVIDLTRPKRDVNYFEYVAKQVMED